MQIIIDEIDNLYYAEVILSPDELKLLGKVMPITAEVIYKRRKCHVTIRIKGEWDSEEETGTGKSQESNEGIQIRPVAQRIKRRPQGDEPETRDRNRSFRSGSL